MLMKNVISILGVLFYSAIASAQYTEANLEGKEWVLTQESDIASMVDMTISFKNGMRICYAKLHASATDTTTIYVQNTIQKYYLSDRQEYSFDESKWRKKSTGVYIITQDLNYMEKSSAEKIVELTNTKIALLLLLSNKKEKGAVRIGKEPTIDYFIAK